MLNDNQRTNNAVNVRITDFLSLSVRKIPLCRNLFEKWDKILAQIKHGYLAISEIGEQTSKNKYVWKNAMLIKNTLWSLKQKSNNIVQVFIKYR